MTEMADIFDRFYEVRREFWNARLGYVDVEPA
jgi:hypothetical protein